MNIQEFKNKWLWKKVDYDSAFWAQCVDLARLGTKELFWIEIWTFSWSALNWWNTWSPFKSDENWIWTRIANSTNIFPMQWDIVFFDKTSVNPYGHVAIVDEWCTGSKLNVIEQNAWSGNWDWLWNNSIRKHTYNYITPKCLGWYSYTPISSDDKNINRIIELWITNWLNQELLATRKDVMVMIGRLVEILKL